MGTTPKSSEIETARRALDAISKAAGKREQGRVNAILTDALAQADGFPNAAKCLTAYLASDAYADLADDEVGPDEMERLAQTLLDGDQPAEAAALLDLRLRRGPGSSRTNALLQTLARAAGPAETSAARALLDRHDFRLVRRIALPRGTRLLHTERMPDGAVCCITLSKPHSVYILDIESGIRHGWTVPYLPYGCFAGSDGILWLCDYVGCALRSYTPEGRPLRVLELRAGELSAQDLHPRYGTACGGWLHLLVETATPMAGTQHHLLSLPEKKQPGGGGGTILSAPPIYGKITSEAGLLYCTTFTRNFDILALDAARSGVVRLGGVPHGDVPYHLSASGEHICFATQKQLVKLNKTFDVVSVRDINEITQGRESDNGTWPLITLTPHQCGTLLWATIVNDDTIHCYSI